MGEEEKKLFWSRKTHLLKGKNDPQKLQADNEFISDVENPNLTDELLLGCMLRMISGRIERIR